jgi:MFS family permease
VILPLVLFVVRERPSERDGLHYLTADDGTAVVHHGHGGGAADAGALRWRDILSRRNFWILVIAYVPMLALYGGCGSNLAPIATSRGLSQQTAGILLSLYSLAQLAATLASGILSDRFGNRVPLAGLAFLTAIGGATLAFGHGVAAMMLGAMFAGVGGSFWPLLAASVAGEFKGQGFGRAFGALMFFLPAAVMSPFAVAKVQENTGSYVPALSVMVVLAVLGGLACLLFLRERRGGHAPAAEEVRVGDAAVPLL